MMRDWGRPSSHEPSSSGERQPQADREADRDPDDLRLLIFSSYGYRGQVRCEDTIRAQTITFDR